MFMHFPCILTLFSIYLILLILLGTFLIVLLFFLPLNLFMLVVSMEPKRKSTHTWNLLRSSASSSTDPSPSNVWFHDDDAFKAFSKNFSRRGIHLERQVILSNFSDTSLPIIIYNRGWESLCGALVTCPSMMIQEFYSNMHEFILQHLSFLLAFEVCTLWSLWILYPRCSMSRE